MVSKKRKKPIYEDDGAEFGNFSISGKEREGNRSKARQNSAGERGSGAGHGAPRKNITQDQGILKKTVELGRRAARGIDSLNNDDYRNYRTYVNGKTELSQFSNKELKFLTRDYKIAGRDTSDIVRELKERGMDKKAFRESSAVTKLYDIRTEKGDLRLGYNAKTDRLMISESDYKGNANIQNWRNLEEGDIKSFMVRNDVRQEADITSYAEQEGTIAIAPERMDSLNRELDAAKPLSEKESQDRSVPLDIKALDNPEALKGKTITTEEGFNGAKQFKVLNADAYNLTLQKTEGNDLKPYIMNVNQERHNTIDRNTDVLGILDSKRVIGHNRQDGQTYIGTIKQDRTVEWKNQEQYLKDVSPSKKASTEKILKNGDYRVDNVRPAGQLDNGNILYVADKGNDQQVVTVNQNDWVSVKSEMGMALLASAGIDIAGLGVVKDFTQSALENSESERSADVGMHVQKEGRQNGQGISI